MPNILIVEDDININNLLCEVLRKAGYTCEQAFSGTEAKLLLDIKEKAYTLVLLDLMLPGASGEEVLREIRKQGRLPVIVLTAKDSIDDKIGVLTDGADDYITKPFSIRELMARIKANLRKGKGSYEDGKLEANTNKIIVGDLQLDVDKFETRVKNKVIDLTLREFEVLKYLANQLGQVVTRETLLEKVWGYEYYGDIRTVDVTVRRIREKIEEDTSNPKILITKRGVGYYIATGDK